MLRIISIIFIPFLLSQTSAGQSHKYFFEADREGLYKIDNPFATPKNIYVTNDEEAYQPYYDSSTNSFVVYCKKKSTYQLQKGLQVKKTISISPIKEIKKEAIYRYSLKNGQNLNKDHWFHTIIEADSLYKEKILVGKLNPLRNNQIKIFTYNFTS